MFAHYLKLAQVSLNVIEKSNADGINKIKEILEQGAKEGIFFEKPPHQAATALYLGTSVFIYPNSFEDPN
jgi:hypothetical protein